MFNFCDTKVDCLNLFSRTLVIEVLTSSINIHDEISSRCKANNSINQTEQAHLPLTLLSFLIEGTYARTASSKRALNDRHSGSGSGSKKQIINVMKKSHQRAMIISEDLIRRLSRSLFSLPLLELWNA